MLVDYALRTSWLCNVGTDHSKLLHVCTICTCAANLEPDSALPDILSFELCCRVNRKPHDVVYGQVSLHEAVEQEAGKICPLTQMTDLTPFLQHYLLGEYKWQCV